MDANRLRGMLHDISGADLKEKSLSYFEKEARLLSSLAWAVERLLIFTPDDNNDCDEHASRLGDVARVIRERAGALESAAKRGRD